MIFSIDLKLSPQIHQIISKTKNSIIEFYNVQPNHGPTYEYF